MILGDLLARLDDRNRKQRLVQHVVRSLKGGIELAELWRGQKVTAQAYPGRAGNYRVGRVASGQLTVPGGLNAWLAAGGVGLLARQAAWLLPQDRVQYPPENRCGHVQQETARPGHFVERWKHSRNVVLYDVITVWSSFGTYGTWSLEFVKLRDEFDCFIAEFITLGSFTPCVQVLSPAKSSPQITIQAHRVIW